MPKQLLTVPHRPQQEESDCPAFSVAPQVVSHGDLDLAWIAYDAYYAVITKGNK
jgi:hypothetical protein